MIRNRLYLSALILLILLQLPVAGRGQEHKEGVCRIGEGRIQFRINLNWTPDQLQKVTEWFDLDSLLLQQAIAGALDSVYLGDGWKLQKISSEIAGLSRTLNPAPPQPPSLSEPAAPGRLFLMDDDWLQIPPPAHTDGVTYGVNDLIRDSAFTYSDGAARFFLPGRANARRVFLSGTFNGWSSTGLPMEQVPGGWTVILPLPPGRYAYKYIIDGRWTADPGNRLKTDDFNGGHNSVVFCYNHKFYLGGYPNARQVTIAGSFNGFNSSELKMKLVAGGWELPLYLRTGTHAYKLIVDGTWITDPANPVVRPDGRGNVNSFIGLGDTTWFRLNGYQSSSKMMLAGNFNVWNKEELAMERTADGWQLPYFLAPGNYEYKFIADGQWLLDPANPYSLGEGRHTNSFLAVAPNHTFVLDAHSDARQVIVTGSFNNWSPSGYRMARIDGRWTLSIHLAPGKHTYKFIVDGRWITDPSNELWEDNDQGTGNSVLWK